MIHRFLPLLLLASFLCLTLGPAPYSQAKWWPFGKDKETPQVEALQQVDAILRPNDAIPLDSQAARSSAFQPDSAPQNEANTDLDAVTLEGVSPRKTLRALRTAPNPNEAAVSALSVAMVNAQDKAAPLKNLRALEARLSEADLKHLWQATIERNHVVRFSLEKIALPPEHHMSHSSEFMRKTLSVLVSGAAMASTLVAPTSGYQNMTVMTGSQVANNYIQNRHKPLSDLSPTEHIQLSYLIDELKEGLVKQYHDYQQAMQTLSRLQEDSAGEEAAYLKAEAMKDPALRMLAIQRYYDYRSAYQRAQHTAQEARIQLERYAGPEAVDALALFIRPQASQIALEQKTQQAIAARRNAEGKVVGAAATLDALPLAEDMLPPAREQSRAQPQPRKRGQPVQLPLLDDMAL